MKQTIDISIGHGPKPGWQGSPSRGGMTEWKYNHGVIRPALERVFANDANFDLRYWDAQDHPEWRTGPRRKNLLLLDRLRAIHKGKNLPRPDVCIALHNNASKNRRYGGFMIIYRQEKNGKVDEYGKLLAELLCAELGEAFPGMKNRGPQGDQASWVSRNLAFTRWAHRRKRVGVIVEFGFMTHAPDVKQMMAQGTAEKYARAIQYALEAYVPLRDTIIEIAEPT